MLVPALKALLRARRGGRGPGGGLAVLDDTTTQLRAAGPPVGRWPDR